MAWDALVDAARAAQTRSYSPYSRYRVGAALLADDGRVFAAANVENASYGLCLCAERSAVACALAAGARSFRAIAIATDGKRAGTPCGMCRQVLAEFSPACEVLCVSDRGDRVKTSVEALLPHGFGPGYLRDP